ncbi:MAG: DUF1849 family protein [Rhodovibrionaceae bacterium]|nr:DUF1849 family protein [Rhodovibrionaceae bacterium]
MQRLGSMGRRRFRPILAALTLSAALLPAQAAGAAVGLAPHRAVYELEMSATRANSNVVAGGGTMEYEWSDVCDGWALSHKARVDLSYSNGRSLSFGWSLTSWEAKDGLSYRFFIRRFSNGEQTEKVRGRASLEGAGEKGSASFSLPEERSVELPAGTLFPTAHTLDVLNRFEEGEGVLWHTVFDGSGDNGLFQISSISAGSYSPGEDLSEDLGESGLLEGKRSWVALFAFFDPQEQASEPTHEQRLRVFPNGVVSELKLDYGDFVLAGAPQEIEALPAPECE